VTRALTAAAREKHAAHMREVRAARKPSVHRVPMKNAGENTPPEGYAAMRRAFACLSDDERRRVLFTLLADEGQRIAHDRHSSLTGAI
jgi:hypothetical protein